jgi:hypothetical protein
MANGARVPRGGGRNGAVDVNAREGRLAMSQEQTEALADDDRSVTVMIRSQGRPSLDAALASVARQTHPRIEVLVVDATGGRHPPLAASCGPFALRMAGAGRPLNRPEAANCALDHARGRWRIFLDDDDFYDPPHVASLLAAATARGCRVAYSGTRLLDADGGVEGVMNPRYGRLKLFQGNFIQMGAALFHRSLCDEGCRFDEQMLLLQDWDFWLQLSARTGFAHTGEVTINWRARAGESGAGTGANADPALRALYAQRMSAKWASEHGRLVEFVRAVVHRADRLLSAHRPGQALRALRWAHAMLPDDPTVLNLTGVALYNAQRLDEAWQALDAAHRMRPEDESIRRNLALVERARGRAENGAGVVST